MKKLIFGLFITYSINFSCFAHEKDPISPCIMENKYLSIFGIVYSAVIELYGNNNDFSNIKPLIIWWIKNDHKNNEDFRYKEITLNKNSNIYLDAISILNNVSEDILLYALSWRDVIVIRNQQGDEIKKNVLRINLGHSEVNGYEAFVDLTKDNDDMFTEIGCSINLLMLLEKKRSD